MTDYDKLRQLAQQATPGKWEAYDPGDGSRKLYSDNPASDVDTRLAVGRDGYSADIRNEDAEFIAAANPTVVLALLDELRRAEELADRLREKGADLTRLAQRLTTENAALRMGREETR